jgi:hypothetical protein
MGRLRGRLKKAERLARSDMASFELLDGSRYYYADGPALFIHWYKCLNKNPPDWPEPPEVLKKLCEARDPAGALKDVVGEGTGDFFPYNKELLISERRLEPRSLVVGRDPYDQVVEDLSE